MKMPNIVRRSACLSIAALLAACATTPLPPDTGPRPAPAPAMVTGTPVLPPAMSPAETTLTNIVSQQDRLYRIATPLLVKNSELCRGNARNLLGFTAKNMYSYSDEYVAASQKLYGMNGYLKVMGVLANSGAARAGMRRGDDLIAIEDKAMPTGQNAERQAATILAPLVNGRSSVKVVVLRNGTQVPMTVPLTYACAFGIELGNTDNVVAYNDGHRVLISRGFINLVGNDDELAYIMAREMAHNILGHAARMRMSATVGGIIDNLVRIRPDTSALTGMSGVKAMTPDYDAAADKLALYLLARAGYSIDGVSAFWQRVAAQYPANVLNAYTALHPSTPNRIAVIDRTVVEIKAKQSAKKNLFP
jgi:Zn-dependent protease with chaperone function